MVLRADPGVAQVMKAKTGIAADSLDQSVYVAVEGCLAVHLGVVAPLAKEQRIGRCRLGASVFEPCQQMVNALATADEQSPLGVLSLEPSPARVAYYLDLEHLAECVLVEVQIAQSQAQQILDAYRIFPSDPEASGGHAAQARVLAIRAEINALMDLMVPDDVDVHFGLAWRPVTFVSHHRRHVEPLLQKRMKGP